MKNRKKIVLGFYLLFSSVTQAAQVDETGLKTVTSVGSQKIGANLVTYFRVAEGWQNAPCAYGVMYFDPSTEAGQVWYAAVMTAKATNTKLSRVVYSTSVAGDGNTICTVSDSQNGLIELN